MADSKQTSAEDINRYPERLSVMIGVVTAIAATLPRYSEGGYQGRLILILIVAAVISVVAFATWRMLGSEARRRVPLLLVRLFAMMLLGGILIGLWQLFGSQLNGLLLLSHGATLGLILYALTLGWRRHG